MSAALVEVPPMPPEVERALRDAFGEQPLEGMTVLRGGRSGSTLLSFDVAGRGYVLRRGNSILPGYDARSARELACMTIGSDRGIAPKLRHVDGAGGVWIMDRILHAPAPRSPARTARVAHAVRRLHEGPAFPRGGGALGFVQRLDAYLRSLGRVGLPVELLRTIEELTMRTARFAESAPCHNDLNPGNILETADAVYFVDWETACQGDPFLDLALLGVFAFPTPEGRAELLEAYLGRAPSGEESARATIARVTALGYYGAAFVAAMVAGGGPPWPSVAAVPVPDALELLRTQRERAPAELVAASLLGEMSRAMEADAYEAAKRVLERDVGGSVVES